MKNDEHKWDSKNPTAQMLGRWQPWHAGHQKLFEEILKKTGQVNIMVRDVKGVDDNPFEVEEVSRMHTEITALKFDINNFNSFYAEFIKSSHLYAHNITQEDVFKTASYVEEEKRKNSLSKSNSFKDYLRDLSIKTTVHLNDLSLTSRISQLSQKTNQFNLTTNRYSISEVEDFMKTDNVFAFSVKDKFGSMGVVGVVIVVENSIDCFLLSCRAFGREIEHSMISVVAKYINTYPLHSHYKPTQKNSMTKDFYSKIGFEIDSMSNGRVNYRLNKKKPLKLGYAQEVLWS